MGAEGGKQHPCIALLALGQGPSRDSDVPADGKRFAKVGQRTWKCLLSAEQTQWGTVPQGWAREQPRGWLPIGMDAPIHSCEPGATARVCSRTGSEPQSRQLPARSLHPDGPFQGEMELTQALSVGSVRESSLFCSICSCLPLSKPQRDASAFVF